MYSFIKSIHSFIPYLLLAGLVISVIVFFTARVSGKTFQSGHKSLSLVVLILAHIQFLLGLILYIYPGGLTRMAFKTGQVMKEPTYRFYAVEHISIK